MVLDIETMNHFFLHGLRFTIERQNLLHKIERITLGFFRKTGTSITQYFFTVIRVFQRNVTSITKFIYWLHLIHKKFWICSIYRDLIRNLNHHNFCFLTCQMTFLCSLLSSFHFLLVFKFFYVCKILLYLVIVNFTFYVSVFFVCILFIEKQGIP